MHKLYTGSEDSVNDGVNIVDTILQERVAMKLGFQSANHEYKLHATSCLTHVVVIIWDRGDARGTHYFSLT